MVICDKVSSRGLSLKHRLPWLDGGTALPHAMPGSFEETDQSTAYSSSTDVSIPKKPVGSTANDISGPAREIRPDRVTPAAKVSHKNRQLVIRRVDSNNANSYRFSLGPYHPDEDASSKSTTDERKVEITTPSGQVSAGGDAQTPPPVPERHPQRQSYPMSANDKDLGISKAVKSLESLLDDTVSVAEDAASQGRPDEVSNVLNEAIKALRQATIIPTRDLDRRKSSLVRGGQIPDLESYESTSDYSRRDVESVASVQIRQGPAMNTPSKKVIIEHVAHQADAPEQGEVIEHSLIETPPRFYVESKDSAITSTAQDSGVRDDAQRTYRLARNRSRKNTHTHGGGMEGIEISPGHAPLVVPAKTFHQAGVQLDNVMLDVPARGSSRHAGSGAEPEPNSAFWIDTRQPRGLADEYYNAQPQHERPSRILEIVPAVVRHDKDATYRNLDPATPGLSLKHRKHFSLRSNQGFSFAYHARRKPVARRWHTVRKRITATVACINTGFVGYVIGVYAGEVPKIQYLVVDPQHYIIQGNVYLFIGLAISTFIFWPLPLLHGRKPYTLGALALVLPLQFPQAVLVSNVRSPSATRFRRGLLAARFFTGLALGFANINFISTLLDLFGASLQSSNPHQELVFIDDVRRQGGGMGMWLGIWAWCFTSSMAIGFSNGSGIIAHLGPEWGFYITVIVGAVVLLLNVIAPETRRSAYRRSYAEFIDDDEKVRRRIARGEVKLHLESEGPIWWGEEVWAGIKINCMMLTQCGYMVLALYTGWTFAQIVLIIVLLGSLLSRDYQMRPQYIGIGVAAIAVGALFAIPLSKASLFSRSRTHGPRTDSMSFERQFLWSSHLVRRLIFMLVLPIAGLAYTLSSPGPKVHWSAPIVLAGLIGFLSNLGIAECCGIIMETFDTSDLQPGTNSRRRQSSLASNVRRRRTNYSSFPRVTSGLFVAQTIGFLVAAAATGVGGTMTRNLSAQTATAITAGVLLLTTFLLTLALTRFRAVQVVPNHAFGTRRNTGAEALDVNNDGDEDWKPVVIGNPSGKMRRMNLLELGHMSRWTEIRRLNRLIKP